ncbi:MAG: 2OG-Fe(II) oxygenase [Oculatellaceae cyanobacterium Prado106]|jgi:Rps23 Pro-64 3,4-dihydroxylase Tpa1-like proline 4-hydroxylase|nr:2OG-Fe(II) oxygenase [Oculatellaceae cyanobacterium Prado106]
MDESELIAESIDVTLLLSGGQEYTVAMQSDDPLLQELFEVLMDFGGKRDRQIFQIPIQKGRAVLTVPCDRLIGLITEPPILIEAPFNPETEVEIEAKNQPHPSPNPVLTSEFVQIEQFLPPKTHQQLLDYVLQQEANFVSTSTSTGELEYRQSTVLYHFNPFDQLIRQRIQEVLPQVLAHLHLPPFTVEQIEAQLTAHNDGHYYRIHNDNGSRDTATRELTYVYYFHRTPKPFSGGQLRLYDSQIQNNYYTKADSFQTVEPIDNSIVFFLSRYMHEVLAIACPSQAFADSRFTINGWVRRS